MKNIITRFAPSPTGYLHVGGLRTALYNYLFAKKNGGKFLLRVEDTDQSRKVKNADIQLIETLKKFGLAPDNNKFVRQSDKIDAYKKIADELVNKGSAYYCFTSKEELDELRNNYQNNKKLFVFRGKDRDLSFDKAKKKIEAGESYVVRLKVPQRRQMEFNDIVRGKVSINTDTVDDQIIIKSDGWPTYHLASVIDDNEMKISHVIRGEEWLSSVPKHILLYKALKHPLPQFAHLPLLVNPDKSKLSKRQGDVSVEDFLKKGYLPEALINFISLLGWNPGNDQEIMSVDELIKTFSLQKVHKSAAVFNTEKLDWINGHYIRRAQLGLLVKLSLPFFQDARLVSKNADVKEIGKLKKIVALEQERIKKLFDLPKLTEYFFKDIVVDKKLLPWKNQTLSETKKILADLLEYLKDLGEQDFEEEKLEEKIKKFIEDKKLSFGEVLWPMRVAMCGKKASPGPFEIAGVLGKDKVEKRIENAIEMLG